MMGVSWGLPKTTIANFQLSLLKKPGGFSGGFQVVYLLTRKQWGFPGGFLGQLFVISGFHYLRNLGVS